MNRSSAVPIQSDSAISAIQLGSVWLMAAQHVLATLGYNPATVTEDRELGLYVDTAGMLYAVESGKDEPPNSVFVCSLYPGQDMVLVAARLRATTSRWG